MILLLAFAFISGFATILAPCIWPLLPIVLASSATAKGHLKPLGITLGIMLSFGFFTLAISYLIKFFHLDPNLLRILAVLVIGFLGLSLIIPAFSKYVEVLVSKIAGRFGQNPKNENGFTGGFITGLTLGIVWSPCAGPILASIATLAAVGKVNLSVVLVTIAYICGIGIPLFLFAAGGQKLFTKTKFISKNTGKIQQIFGVVMLLSALAIYTNYDKVLEAKLLDIFPQFSTTLNSFESNPNVQNQLNVLKGNSPAPQNTQTNTKGLFNQNKQAPDFIGITNWLNSGPLSKEDLKGKVVLVDFWTYTCINCIRTLPHITSWYDKYKDQGFVVVGVHSPEFAFEKETKNVANAIKMFNIHYPVAQDNDLATWNNFQNQYWPAEYLIDANGKIRRTHFGEGEYEQTEMAIQQLLKEAGKPVQATLVDMPDETPTGRISPETYLGAQRAQYYFPYRSLEVGKKNFSLENPPKNSFSLGGEWTIVDENAQAGPDAKLVYNFNAQKVFLVMRPNPLVSSKVKIYIDGQLANETNSGTDVKNGEVTIDVDRLYNLVDLKDKVENHILTIEFKTPGIGVFAFTFG